MLKNQRDTSIHDAWRPLVRLLVPAPRFKGSQKCGPFSFLLHAPFHQIPQVLRHALPAHSERVESRAPKSGDRTLVIHYSASNGNVACGRTGSSLNSSADAARVSCKRCIRSVEKAVSEPVRKTPSLADLRAAAKATKTAAVAPATGAATAANAPHVAVETATRTPATAVKTAPTVRETPTERVSIRSARAEWQQHLEQLPGRNRLPRGVSRQAFI